jgi:hypothetical protein
MSCDVFFFRGFARQPSEPKKTRLCLPEAKGMRQGDAPRGSWDSDHRPSSFRKVINRKIFKDIAGQL